VVGRSARAASVAHPPKRRDNGDGPIPAEKIRAKLLSKVGQPFDMGKIHADVKSLMETEWFSDVQVYYEESPSNSGKLILTFAVREMPVLTHVEFRGRKAIPLEEIQDATGLKKGNRADPTRTRNAVRSILRLYQERGYDLAEVELIEGGNPGDTKVIMQIFEGPKGKFASIDFVGCQFATAAMLRTRITTRIEILGSLGRFKEGLLDGGRQRLIDYYQGRGFFEAKVTPVTRPGRNPGEIDLTFVIREGPWYSVRKVILQGNSRLKTERLMDGLELHSGKPYLASVRDADKKRILIKYREIGCIDAEVSVEPRFTSEAGVVDLLYNISEREPFLLGEMEIERRNPRTKIR
jgi:outer membrane protein insertion porin family